MTISAPSSIRILDTNYFWALVLPALSIEEFEKLLVEVDKHVTSYPPTAQLASQEGKYCGQLLNQFAMDGYSFENTKPFVYHHLGSLAYIGGGSSAIDLNRIKLSGVSAWFMWHGIYWSEQFSWRSKAKIFSFPVPQNMY